MSVFYNYQGYRIEIDIFEGSNTIEITIENLDSYWFEPESNDPQDWEEEAFEDAQKCINDHLRR